MPRTVQTEYATPTEVSPGTSGVKSTPGQGKDHRRADRPRRISRFCRACRSRFFAKRWAYRPGYWLVTPLFNVFPLPQFSGFRQSFRFAGESVDRGYSVLVFPEGVVNNSEDGRMAPFQSGIGLLAENLGIPVVPMRLDGVWQMKREGRRLAQLGEITVRIGTPLTFAPGTPPGEIARQLETIVKSL